MKIKYAIGVNLLCLVVTLLSADVEAASDVNNDRQIAAMEVVKARISAEEYEVMISQYVDKVSGAGKKRKCPPLDIALKEYWKKKLNYDDMLLELSREFSHNFSVDELKEIAEFYQSDAGKKFAQLDDAYKQHLNMKIYSEFTRYGQGMSELFVKYRPGTESCK